MPRLIVVPDPDSLIAEFNDVQLYARVPSEKYPLYRFVKLISARPLGGGTRRTAQLTYIVHLQRFVWRGAGLVFARNAPGLLEWARLACAESLSPEYIRESLGITCAEYERLVDAEIARYARRTTPLIN